MTFYVQYLLLGKKTGFLFHFVYDERVKPKKQTSELVLLICIVKS